MQAIRSINHTKLSKYIFLLLSGNELENPFFFGTSYWTPYRMGFVKFNFMRFAFKTNS